MRSRKNRDPQRCAFYPADLWRNPKYAALGNEALGLLSDIWSWCADQDTYVLTKRGMQMICQGDRNASRCRKALLEGGHLTPVEGGWQIHDVVIGLAQPPRPPSRGPVPRLAIFARDGWKCFYCETPITAETGRVDHVHPFSRGGSDEPENLAAACKRCNYAKGSKTIEEWSEWMRASIAARGEP